MTIAANEKKKKSKPIRRGINKGKIGRPTRYYAEYAEQARKLCLVGYTDIELADFFGVCKFTIYKWQARHPKFKEAIRDGKEIADCNVAEALYKRALGYSHPAVKIVADAKTKEEHVVEYIQYYPPDTSACSIWMKNRQPDRWREKQHHELTGKDGGAIKTETAVTVELDFDAIRKKRGLDVE